MNDMRRVAIRCMSRRPVYPAHFQSSCRNSADVAVAKDKDRPTSKLKGDVMKRYIALFLAVAFGVTILAVPLSAHNYSANWPRVDREYSTTAEPQGDDSGWHEIDADGKKPVAATTIDIWDLCRWLTNGRTWQGTMIILFLSGNDNSEVIQSHESDTNRQTASGH